MGSFDYGHVDVFVGVDMAKQDHFAQAIDRDGNERFARSVANDLAAIEAVIDDGRPSRPGRVGDRHALVVGPAAVDDRRAAGGADPDVLHCDGASASVVQLRVVREYRLQHTS